MKKLLIIPLCTLFSLSVNCQTTVTIDQNNCSAMLMDIGEFFGDNANSLPGYEVPKGGNANSIYSSALWFVGTDPNSQIKLAAPRYYPNGQDMWPGALTDDGAATLPNPNPFSQTFWIITQVEIQDHINNFSSPGYVMPNDIANWPAHGDTTVGQDFYLAPFIDVNGNNLYDPSNGDYPCVKGDKAAYTIVNDKGGVHGSGGDPIGIEVHYMFYQYSTNDHINNTTFIDARVINRGTQTLSDFASSYWVDADVGNYADDFFGCDTNRNLAYAYNGDDIDEDNAGTFGYGALPPAAGVICLNHDLSSATMFTNGAAFPNADPTDPVEYNNIMHGTRQDGSPWLDNNTLPTKYLYSGNPNNPTEWSEESEAATPGDRRLVASVEKGTNVLVPGEEYNISFAAIYAQDSTRLASVNLLLTVADEVQAFYDNISIDCYSTNIGISELQKVDFKLFPNPSNGIINIELADQYQNAHITFTTVSGDLIWSGDYSSINKGQINLGVSPGVYFVNVRTDANSVTKKLIVE